jgi:hypothetical protein
VSAFVSLFVPSESKGSAVTVFRDVELRWKLVGATAVLLVLLAIEAALAGKPVAFAVLGGGVVIGGGMTALVFVRLTTGVSAVAKRIDAVEEAAKGNLMRGAPSARGGGSDG